MVHSGGAASGAGSRFGHFELILTDDLRGSLTAAHPDTVINAEG